MALFNAAAVFIPLAALFSWLNYRFLRQPATIANRAARSPGSCGVTSRHKRSSAQIACLRARIMKR
jgi:hypothetical protein